MKKWATGTSVTVIFAHSQCCSLLLIVTIGLAGHEITYLPVSRCTWFVTSFKTWNWPRGTFFCTSIKLSLTRAQVGYADSSCGCLTATQLLIKTITTSWVLQPTCALLGQRDTANRPCLDQLTTHRILTSAQRANNNMDQRLRKSGRDQCAHLNMADWSILWAQRHLEARLLT